MLPFLVCLTAVTVVSMANPMVLNVKYAKGSSWLVSYGITPEMGDE
jgi:hypothetical protein